VGDTETTDDSKHDDALAAASRWIDHFCRRQFNTTSTASARLFYPDGYSYTEVDDFATTVDLAIATDQGADGTYETTWAAADYQLEPLNGINDGESGWPYSKIRAVGSYRFPCVTSVDRAPLQVTAKWGWTAVPGPVKHACLLLASEALKLAREAPFGVAGFGAFGAVRVRDNPRAESMLEPYRRYPVLVA
jgi:hypothetical protein